MTIFPAALHNVPGRHMGFTRPSVFGVSHFYKKVSNFQKPGELDLVGNQRSVVTTVLLHVG